MSCHNQTYNSVSDWPGQSAWRDRRAPVASRSDQPFVLWLVTALYESFHEALKMRREAYKQHRLPEE
jgi:hypothetical protein